MNTQPKTTSGRTRRRGEPYALGQAFGYAVANTFDRLATIHADPLIGPFWRGLPSLVLGLVLVWKHRTIDQVRPSSPRYIGRRAILSLVMAGVVSTLGLFVYYFAIRLGGVTITIPALQTYVIWGTIIAWFFLHERISVGALAGLGLIAVGLGVLAVGQYHGQPVNHLWYRAVPLALFTALTYGISGVLWRDGQLRGAHQSIAILLQFTTSMLVAGLGLAAFGHWSSIKLTAGRDVLALLSSGVLSGVVGVYCMFAALRLMSVARVYAFSSLTPLLAALLAHFFLGEYLNLLMLTGVLIVSGGVALTHIFRPAKERQAE